jgi:hypothetical protein
VIPAADNTYDLGSPSYRWNEVYTGPLGLRVYNVTGTDYELMTLGWSSNTFLIVGSCGEGGSVRPIRITPNQYLMPGISLDPTFASVGIGTLEPYSGLSVSQPSDLLTTLTHRTSALANFTNEMTDLVITMDVDSPSPCCLQVRSYTEDNPAFPLCLNPLGGNVGVGNQDPGSTLDVSGKTRTRQLSLQAKTELTIASGAITVTRAFHTIDTEGDAASDDLDTIDGGEDGMILVIRPVHADRTVVVKDGSGNLQLNGDFTMDDASDTLTLIYDADLSKWVELARSNNG